MKKRIAFFTNSLARGGAERVISRIIPSLRECYDVYLILIDGSRIEYECPAEIIKLGGAEKKNRILYLCDQIAAQKKLKKVIKEYGIECVISFLSVPNLINILTSSDYRRIISIRGSMDYELQLSIYGRIKYYMCKKQFPRADAIICVSNMIRQKMIQNWKVKNDKVFTIENPYDIMEISSLAEEKVDEKETLFYEKHRVIAAVGRIEKQKGFLHLLESFHYLLSNQQDAGLVIVGEGSERSLIEERAKQLGIENRVMLCGVKKNPFPNIRNARVFVLSSITEGFPNVLVEAMCCGTPVIACDCKTGPREILYQNPDINMTAKEIEMADYGILVPDFTSRNKIGTEEKKRLLAEAMQIMINDTDIWRQYSEKALERAQYYTLERCVEKYREIIG